MQKEVRIKGLCIKATPLGENDRLATILSEEYGISRFAVPGARRPKSSLAAVAPLTYLDLQIYGTKSLKKIRQLKIIKSFSGLGKNLECLAAAQAINELTFLLVGNDDSQQNYLHTVLVHLERLYSYKSILDKDIKILAMCIQSLIHLLAIGGINLPLHFCCRTGKNIHPPIGNWKWACYFNPNEGFSTMCDHQTQISLNASEIALMQRLLFPELPIKSTGDLLGPKVVWLKLLNIIESWIKAQLNNELSSLKFLGDIYNAKTTL